MRTPQDLGLNLREIIENKIKNKGGWVNSHAHFDRAYTLTKENFHLSQIHFQKKWSLNSQISKNSSVAAIYSRMEKATEIMLQQGVQAIGMFIDVYPLVQDKAIKAATKLRENYKDDVTLKFINQPLQGVIAKESYQWFKIAADFVDIIGGLPSKDAVKEEQHLDILLSKAKEKGKMVHVHVDQLNDPKERETELLVQKTVEHGMEGKVVAIHAISVAAQAKQYRMNLYQKMKDAGIMVIANPTAYLDDKRKETLVPSHNAITPVDEMVPAGITVALGTDNINDLHKPFTDGDMWIELRVLLEACRFYDIDALVDIATVNGLRILGIKND